MFPEKLKLFSRTEIFIGERRKQGRVRSPYVLFSHRRIPDDFGIPPLTPQPRDLDPSNIGSPTATAEEKGGITCSPVSLGAFRILGRNSWKLEAGVVYLGLPNANKEEAHVHDISTFRTILEDPPVSASIPRMRICFLWDSHNLHS